MGNFTSMASLYSPSAKLDLLLSTMSSLLSSSTNSLVPVSVPSFCSLLAYLVVHTGVETLEVEAEWMWGLLHPSSPPPSTSSRMCAPSLVAKALLRLRLFLQLPQYWSLTVTLVHFTNATYHSALK